MAQWILRVAFCCCLSGCAGALPGAGDGGSDCWKDEDCPKLQYCAIPSARCAAGTANSGYHSGRKTCQPLPCASACVAANCTGCVGYDCRDDEDCGPTEYCDGFKCTSAGMCTIIPKCPETCAVDVEPHIGCYACLCEACN